jgi:hypothetical protein
MLHGWLNSVSIDQLHPQGNRLYQIGISIAILVNSQLSPVLTALVLVSSTLTTFAFTSLVSAGFIFVTLVFVTLIFATLIFATLISATLSLQGCF